jgi:Cu/Ag efflux protein CusF
VNKHTFGAFLVALILAGTFLAVSCNRSQAPAAKRYPFTGRVVSVDSQAQSAIIDGDAIPGFMDAMAMPYKVKNAAGFNQLSVGDSISAEVVVAQSKDKDAVPDYWIENVKVTGHSKAPADKPTAGKRRVMAPQTTSSPLKHRLDSQHRLARDEDEIGHPA